LDPIRRRTNNPIALWWNAPKTVQANFAANLAASNVPEWWLAAYGWTNDFDAAATNDAEPDGYFTWQEYVADTDPTNAASRPQLAYLETWQTNAPVLTWPFSTGRLYQVHYCEDPRARPLDHPAACPRRRRMDRHQSAAGHRPLLPPRAPAALIFGRAGKRLPTFRHFDWHWARARW
jgi:hypothetical protein